MWTKEEKEIVVEELYDWDVSPYLAGTWKTLDEETKKRILAKVDFYLENPINEIFVKRILLSCSKGTSDTEANEELEKQFPKSISATW